MIQMQFINYLLQSKDSNIIPENALTDEYFTEFKKEFNYIKEHEAAYGVIPDTITFLGEFPEFNIFEVTESPKYLLDRLKDEKFDRDMIISMNTFTRMYQEKGRSAALSYFNTDLYPLTVNAIKGEAVDIIADTSRLNDYIDKKNNVGKYYIPTGFKELDEVVGGWDRHEELATIIARTNTGKSWFLVMFAAEALKHGLTVGYYSGEMSVNKVAWRLDTVLSHISNTALTKGGNVEKDYRNYISTLSTKYQNNFFVLTPVQLGGPAGVTALRAFIRKNKLDILFIDQDSLLEDDRNAKVSYEKLANISKDLKNLQVSEQIPIIAAQQQNRQKPDDKSGVGTENVAGSDRIAQDSTIVIAFEKTDNGTLILNLIKSRDSAKDKKLEYNIDFDRGYVKYIPDENDSAGSAAMREEFDGDSNYETNQEEDYTF